jgi:hypothetical protein
MPVDTQTFHVRAFVADAADGGRSALDALARIVSPLGELEPSTAKPYWKISSWTELNVSVRIARFERALVHAALHILGTGWVFSSDDDESLDAIVSTDHGGALELPGGTFAWVHTFPQSSRSEHMPGDSGNGDG